MASVQSMYFLAPAQMPSPSTLAWESLILCKHASKLKYITSLYLSWDWVTYCRIYKLNIKVLDLCSPWHNNTK